MAAVAHLVMLLLLLVTRLTSAQQPQTTSLREYMEQQASRWGHDPGEQQPAETVPVNYTQVSEETARVPSLLLTPPAVHAPRNLDYVAATGTHDVAFHSSPPGSGLQGEDSQQPLASSASPSFDNQQTAQPDDSYGYAFDSQKSGQAVAPDGYASFDKVSPFDSQRTAQPAASAPYVSSAISSYDGQRIPQAIASSAYAYPTFYSQGNTASNALPVYSSPQPSPNPYLIVPKLALKAVPFDSYPHPQMMGMPQVYEPFTPPEPQPTYKPLKLYKYTPTYPKKYRPELEQGKLSTVDQSDVITAGKKSRLHLPKEDYPLVKQHKQSAHNVAVTKQAASFDKAAQSPANQLPEKDVVISAKQSAPAVTKLSPSVEQSAAASGFFPHTDGTGVGAGLTDHHDAVAASLGPGHERVEFQMYGQQGPHSYKFGFDTGKGHNRQFRYEERDPQGHVKGHYGFYNKHGKLQIVSYTAHPEHGFHADNNFGKHAL